MTEADRLLHHINSKKIILLSPGSKTESLTLDSEKFEQFKRDRGELISPTSVQTQIPAIEVNKSNNELVFSGTEINTKDFLKTQFDKIEKLQSGKLLLKNIADALDTNPMFTGGLAISFLHEDEERSTFRIKDPTLQIPRINLNLWENNVGVKKSVGDISFPEIYTTKPLIKSKTSIPMGGELSRDAVEIGEGLSPFYLTLAHELTHLKHAIENKGKIKQLQKIEPSHPIDRSTAIWKNREEHRTVFSPADISEMKLRMEAGEPLRYIYQDRTKSFFEPVKTVLKNAIESEYLDAGRIGGSFNADSLISTLVDLQSTIDKLPTKPYQRPNENMLKKQSTYAKIKTLPHL
jgi:hypothetical protein